MKQHFLLSIITVCLLASCSTAFKNGQTPDDVYYSPTREVKEEIKKETKKEEYATNDDNYLRMKVRRYTRFSVIDDYSYWNDTRYDYNCNSYAYAPYHYSYNAWQPHYFGNTWYNPYYTLIPYKNPTVYTGNTTASNIKSYSNHSFSNSNYTNTYNPKTGSGYNNGNGFGSLVKKVFSSNNGTTSTWDRPVRTFDQPTSSSSSSSTSSSSTPPATSSSAGGNSGGYNSTGSSTSSGRGGRN